MADAPKKSGKKVGGLKTWQWAAAGVGTYGIYTLYKKHQANVAAATGAVDTTGTSGAGPATTSSVGSIDPSTGQTWASEGINPITGLPLSTVTSTSGTTRATSATLSSFEKAFTLALRTDFSAADAQRIYNDLLSGNAMGARQARIAQGILANLETQGLVPAGFVPIIHVQNAAAGVTTQAHTITETPAAPVAPAAPRAPITAPVVRAVRPVRQSAPRRPTFLQGALGNFTPGLLGAFTPATPKPKPAPTAADFSRRR
jgi:hypothetical protein